MTDEIHDMQLSVLTPSFNYGHFIDDCLDSVAQQAMTIEHVVQDGASSDHTPAKLGAREHLIWASVPDEGQSDAMNRALARSSGTWIGWLNADEFYLPRGPEVLLDHALASGADIVFGDPVFVDEGGRFVRLVTQHPFHPLFLKYYGCFISSCAVLLRRDVLGATPWDTNLRMAMDWDLYLRLVEGGARVGYVPFPVAAFRLHPSQVIARAEMHNHEHEHLRRRYGIGTGRVRKLGRWPHDLFKLVTGGYPRQNRVNRAMVGRSLRWFASDEDASNVTELTRLYRA